MIKVENLWKSFDDLEVLKDVSFEVFNNETLVILGPSGQGKTVLIKTMLRIHEPDSGSLIFDGEKIGNLKRKELVNFRKKIAFVFQHSALFDFLNVKENLALYLKMHESKNQEEIDKEINKALSFVALERDVLDKYPEELSGGMKKRVSIARAMMKKPKYIFYDEPTTGLDKKNAELVTNLIQMLKEEISITSVIVTHDIELMENVSDRVALLREGEMIYIGERQNISDDKLEYLYSIGE